MSDDFAEFEAKVQEVMDILNEDPENPSTEETKPNFDNIDVDSVRLKVRENRTVINKRTDDTPKDNVQTMDQYTFMQQVEKDAQERSEENSRRQNAAQHFRSQGNEAFRKCNYEKAILQYTKALEQVKDSAITYNNRALCYIKLSNYKRALEDCDHVLKKLDEINLRAWLYSATVYKRLNDVRRYEGSLKAARESNPDQLTYIQKFVDQIEENL